MAVKLANVIHRMDLTNYAFGLMQDLQKARDLIELLAPVVPTGGTAGLYNTFEKTQAFKAYSDSVARRAVGGQATTIGLLSDTANYNLEPYGLRTFIDEHEKAQAGAALSLLEFAKTRTLTINCLLSFLNSAATTIGNGVAAVANKGNWSSANVDPVAEIDAQILAIWQVTGIVPNNIVFDFAAWNIFKNNPLVTKKFVAIQVAPTIAMAPQLFLNPNAKVTVAETAILTGGGLGNASATRSGLFGTACMVFFNSAIATQYDPSFCKTFAETANMFTEVFTYRQEPHLDFYENDWTAQTVVISSALARKLAVS